MAYIKAGDIVVQDCGNFLIAKVVKAINPRTISLITIGMVDGRQYETAPEPKQDPGQWRVAVPEITGKIKKLFEESDRLRREANELYRTLPKIEL